MTTHLRVSWAVLREPWAVLAALLSRSKPPLKQAEKPRHPLHPLLRNAHTTLESVAQEAPVVNSGGEPTPSGPSQKGPLKAPQNGKRISLGEPRQARPP